MFLNFEIVDLTGYKFDLISLVFYERSILPSISQPIWEVTPLNSQMILIKTC